MPAGTYLRSLFRNLTRGRRLNRDLDDELRSAVDELTERHVRRGLTREQASRRARIDIGGLTQVREQVRESRTGAGLERLAADIRYAIRALRKSPAFSAAVVGTFALGIGANTAIFSVLSAVLIEPLPYRDPHRLAIVWADWTAAGYPRAPLAGPELLDLRTRAATIEAIEGIWSNTVALSGDGDPEQLRIGLVTAGFFRALGVDTALGRTFLRDDEQTKAPSPILLSWDLWQRRYGGKTEVVGQRILVDGAPTTVIGVMPRGFRLWLPADANVPTSLQAWRLLPSNFTQWPRGQQFLRVVARLRPGIRLDQVNEDLARISSQLGREFTEYGAAPPTFFAVALHADGVREFRRPLLMLFGGVNLLLAMACVNVANLLIARAAARRRELAMRIALGASMPRLLRLAMVEGLLLATAGGSVGSIIAAGGLEVLLAMRPAALERIGSASLDLRVLAFTAATALAWGLLFSLAPFAEAMRMNVSSAVRNTAAIGTAIGSRIRYALVVCEVAFGLVLLVSALLLVRGFTRLQHVDPGFRADETITFRVVPPRARYSTPEAWLAFARRVTDSVRALPGVTAISGISHLPYDNLPNWSTPYLPEGTTDRSLAREADARAILPEFFATVHARIVEGRDFTPDDDFRKVPVAIVDTRLASRAWPGQNAVGKRLVTDPQTTGTPETLVTVVGVVEHLRHRTPAEEVREQIYYPQFQVFRSPLAFVVRSTSNSADLAAPIRRTVAGIDSLLPVYDVRLLEDYLHEARGIPRFTTWLAGVFAAVALLLGAVGLYGVMAYTVTARRREFGVRMALGASRPAVLGLVIREAALLALRGAALGGIVALGTGQLLRAELHGLQGWDPIAFGLAILTLALAVLMASIVPAWRATRTATREALCAE